MEFTEIESKTDIFRKYVKGEIDIMLFDNICIVFNRENEKSKRIYPRGDSLCCDDSNDSHSLCFRICCFLSEKTAPDLR